jgi:hypothetical protein
MVVPDDIIFTLEEIILDLSNLAESIDKVLLKNEIIHNAMVLQSITRLISVL